MNNQTQPQVMDYDPFTPAVMQDPTPFYEYLRQEQPFYYLEKYDSYFLSRFADIAEVLSYTDNTFMQTEGSLPTPAALRVHNHGQAPEVAGLDPFPISQRLGNPIHSQVRRAHIAPMMPAQLKQLQNFILQLTNERLDQLLPKGKFNLTRDFGGYVSSNTIMHLMGMPKEEAEFCLDLVNSGTTTDPELGGFDSAATAKKAIQHYLPYVQARMDAGADGSVPMVDGLINFRLEGRALNAAEVAQNLVCAFIGGIESVPKVTAHGLMELANHPEQQVAVRSDLEKNTPKAVEEMLRYCAPAQWFIRTVHKEVTINGQKMLPGQRVFLLNASALRDDREYKDPYSFQWDRHIPRTLAFGQGMHFCIGAHLARLEIKTMVKTFLERVPNYSFDMANAERPASSFQIGWNTLPVIIGEGWH
ncbi:cytochrome P450 [Halioxenophilus sp. WMMB6]|uniref:cytochrome P450 n=1 Tax=Halioxenophilus sp. WMMB6 TaxID=3073815 RepID=UPI00295E23D1|nr:cytochrome P450 [Halioxenophilus sp. WMMB6]